MAFAGYPLVVEDRLVGVWATFSRRPMSELTLRAMDSVATAIGLGIERKRAEEELARSEAWLATTLASIGDGVVVTDERGLVKFLNPVAEGLTGWPADRAVGRPVAEIMRIIAEPTRRPAEDPVGRVIREGAIVGLANHTLLIARDGTETAIEDSAAPIRDARGGLIGVVMVFRDATAQRRHEAELRESERRHRTILDSFSDAFFALGADWRFHYVNRPAEQLLGRAPGELLGRDLWEEFPGLIGSVFEPEYRRAARERVGTSVTAHYPDHDRWYEVQIDPAREGISVYFRDVSERKRHEQERERLLEEAQEASRAKSHFLAVLSHELRTPLNPILLATSAMLEHPGDPAELRPTLEMIRQNVNLQSRLIDDLLDVMRIVRGKMPLHWEVADGHEVIRHAIHVCASEVFGKAVRLELDLAAERHHLNADSARLQQVFWNLIKNAVKFSPEGGTLTIRTRNEGSDERRLIVEVSDTGIGIDPAVLPTIWDPFQQGETSVTRRFGGLGLGLAICRGIVDAHGGSIAAESPGPGRGTTFRVDLKALPEPIAEASGAPADAPDAPVARPSAGPRLEILVVEDEAATRRLMARLLRGLGHEVTTAGTVAEAVEAARSAAFGLIISDIGLPDGSGLDLIRQIVAIRGKVPAIALTGYGMEEDILRSREAGFTAHMTKPIDFIKLEAMIRQVVP